MMVTSKFDSVSIGLDSILPEKELNSDAFCIAKRYTAITHNGNYHERSGLVFYHS